MKIKIKAFTMLEALIILNLTGIIITLSYSLFTLVNKQMAMFQQENVAVINYNLFNSTLTNDINNANDFSFKDQQLVLKNYYKPTITYRFSKDSIARTLEGLNTDNFELKAFNVSYLDKVTPKHSKLNLSLRLLNDTISVNYFLHEQNSTIINKRLFNED